MTIRLVHSAEDATAAAQLLDDFNREFDTPSPGPSVIADRLARLLAGDTTFAVVFGQPMVGIALVTLRTNIWYDVPVGLLDELYVVPDRRNEAIGTALIQAVERELADRGGELLEIFVDGEDVDAQRFYERHGYADREPGESLATLRYYRELT